MDFFKPNGDHKKRPQKPLSQDINKLIIEFPRNSMLKINNIIKKIKISFFSSFTACSELNRA